MELVGLLDDASETDKAVAAAFATFTASTCGGSLQTLQDIAFALFQGSQHRFDGLVLDGAFIGTSGPLGDDVAGQHHLGHFGNHEGTAIGQGQLNRAPLRGDNGFAFQHHVARLEFPQLTVAVACVGLADHCHYGGDCFTGHV